MCIRVIYNYLKATTRSDKRDYSERCLVGEQDIRLLTVCNTQASGM